MAGKDLIETKSLHRGDIFKLFLLTEKFKNARYSHEKPLSGRTFALIFEKPSLRTRVTFETAINELGGNSIYLSSQDIGLGKREPVKDVAENLSRWVSGIVARVFEHKSIEDLAKYASVPVVNALSDLEHPCQALADFFTIWEFYKGYKDLKFAWVGDGNNVCHSLMLFANLCGLKMHVATPKGYEPQKEYIKLSSAVVTNDPVEAVRDADIIYTDVWTSMGQEEEKALRLEKFKAFQINAQLVKHAKPSYILMHCLPAHRGEEITAEVIDSPHSVILDQAENRMHTEKAVMAWLCGNLKG
ncbi:MAG: ornithine carbamoyltransferase [bacterium]|nr:ornithine carbamoyltransferase [bacterium]